jgi:tRNA A37 methylthiotransferase MiaB
MIRAKSFIGKTYRVLAEKINSKDGGLLDGMTYTGRAVTFKADRSLLNSFVDIKVEESKNGILLGQLIF